MTLRKYLPLFALLAPLCAGPTAHAQVVINEFLASNGTVSTDENADNSDWIELHNTAGGPVDLAGWGLSDDPADPFRWTFPPIEIEPGGFMIVWASGKDRDNPAMPLHTNFSISAAGDELVLTRADGSTADFVPAVEHRRDVSYGRKPDGAGGFVYFADPTPGAANTTEAFEGLLNPPVYSRKGGFHTAPFQLMLTAEPGATIRFTTDASEPDESSAAFNTAIQITDRSNEPNDISTIRTVGTHLPHLEPDGPIKKATLVRARAYRDGWIPSELVTQTYIVDPLGADRYSLPVISLAVDRDALFDEDQGIYVPGVQYNPGATNSANRNGTGNFARRGRAWEFPTSFEFFETDGSQVINQLAGFRLHGGLSRSYHRKSVRLYARADYGEDHFNYKFFDDQDIDVFKRIIIRNGGQEYDASIIADQFSESLFGHDLFDIQSARAVILFLNGEYWGIHHLRDRVDRYMIGYRYGLDPDRIDLLTRYGTIKSGRSTHYNQMKNFIMNNDMAVQENFEEVKRRMDMENFIDYIVAQIHIENGDWPQNNIDFWRFQAPEGEPVSEEHHPADGRWRWIMYDIESSMHPAWVGRPTMERMIAEQRTDVGKFILRFLDNEEFRISLGNRFADFCNEIAAPDRFLDAIEVLREEILLEMPEHNHRWPHFAILGQWEDTIEVRRFFASERPPRLLNHIESFLELDGQHQVTVSVAGNHGGHVRVNRLDIISDQMPWTGTYFGGSPLPITPVPDEGYRFAGWQGRTGAEATRTTFDLEGDISLVAVFEPVLPAAVIHVWDFNDESEFITPSYTVGGAGLFADLAEDSELTTDSGQGFVSENARLGELPGSHLRLNFPIGSSLTFALPTDGYESPVLSYETRRSGSGAGTQAISVSTDGNNFEPFGVIGVFSNDPTVVTLDFSEIEGADNNPDFSVRIEFALGGGGDVGNNRFDNVVLEARPLPSTTAPPVVAQPNPAQNTWQGASFYYDLGEIFTNLNSEPLSFSFESDDPATINGAVDGDELVFTPLRPGATTARLTATDGVNPPITLNLRYFVYPAPLHLITHDFFFGFWGADEPELTFPDHMMFLQSDIDDPAIDDSLDFPYFIPADDYAAADQGTIGFPYNNTARTRINGLDANGVSFINTGRGRDLGGALLALDTRGVSTAELDFLVGTILRNNRTYGMRLQYRVGVDEAFRDLMIDGAPADYVRNDDGHIEEFEGIALPSDMLSQPYVQLLWRYYYISGVSGPRPEMRLDNILLVLDRGELTVDIEPDRAVQLGARWRILGTDQWRDPGSTVNIPVGVHQIEFETVARWNPPAPIQVEITPGGSMAITGTYTSAIETDSWLLH